MSPVILYAPSKTLVSTVKVSNGTTVRKGDVLLNLTVMKMSKSVISPVDGIVDRVEVQEGQIVEQGQALIRIKSGEIKDNSKQEQVKQEQVKQEQVKQEQVKQEQVKQDQVKQKQVKQEQVKQEQVKQEQVNQESVTELGWTKEINELRHRQDLAKKLGGPSSIERQHKAGKQTCRERLDLLLDPGSFREVGTLAGRATYTPDGTLKDFIPANCTGGTGKISGRTVMVTADDFTVRGGHADGAILHKVSYLEALARNLRTPLIRLLDGSSGGGSVTTLLEIGATYVPWLPGFEHSVAMLKEVPVAAALLGPVVGMGAARSQVTHFSVIVRELGHLFVAGPPVVAQATHEHLTKEQLGGWAICTGNGCVDHVVDSETEALASIKCWLSYLPSHTTFPPPRGDDSDPADRREESLLSIIPRDRSGTYDVRRLIMDVIDRGSFFEFGVNWGGSVVVGLCRVRGYPVGVIASDPRQDGGALTVRACEKILRHMGVCETFGLPILNFVDCPGFAVGSTAEHEGTIRRGTELLSAMYRMDVPMFTCIVRRCFGVGGAAMVLAHRRVAWPSGDWGSLPVEGGLEAGFKQKLDNAADPALLKNELLAKLNSVRSPFRTAEHFGIPEIIDPRETRPYLCEWVQLIYQTKVVNKSKL